MSRRQQQLLLGSAGATTGWHFAALQTNVASAQVRTFAAFSLGAPSAKRVVVACIAWSHSLGSTITAITIGGVAGALVQNQITYSTTGRCAMYYALVPSGQTADVVVTLSTTTASGMACGVFYGYPGTSSPLDSGVSTATLGALVTVADIQIAAGGILIAFGAGGVGGIPYTMAWSGSDALTTDSESTAGITGWSVRHTLTTQNTTTDDLTSDPSGSAASALIGASWGA